MSFEFAIVAFLRGQVNSTINSKVKSLKITLNIAIFVQITCFYDNEVSSFISSFMPAEQ